MTPLCHLLLHLAACDEAVQWAGSRPIAESALDECPLPEWREWLAERLGVGPTAAWPVWESAIAVTLCGDGHDSGGYGQYSFCVGPSDGGAVGEYGYGDTYGHGVSLIDGQWWP